MCVCQARRQARSHAVVQDVWGTGYQGDSETARPWHGPTDAVRVSRVSWRRSVPDHIYINSISSLPRIYSILIHFNNVLMKGDVLKLADLSVHDFTWNLCSLLRVLLSPTLFNSFIQSLLGSKSIAIGILFLNSNSL